MMMSCPKCHFSQPEDRFCAQCGVDMVAFRARNEQQQRNWKRNPKTFLVGALALLLFGISTFQWGFRNNQETQPLATFSKTDSVLGDQQIEFSNQSQDGIAKSTTPGGEPPTSGQTASFEAASVAQPIRSGAATQFSTATVLLHFVEMDNQVLETLRDELSSTGQFTDFGDFRSALLIDPRVILKNSPPYTNSQAQVLTRSNLSAQWTEPGFRFATQMESLSGVPLKGQINIQRVLPDRMSRSLPVTNFEIQPGMGWLIHLDLANYLSQEDLVAGAKQGPLAILNFPRFISKQSNLALVFEFQLRNQSGESR